MFLGAMCRAKGEFWFVLPWILHLAMNFNGGPPEKWLVDINPRLNGVHQRVPKYNSYPFVVTSLGSKCCAVLDPFGDCLCSVFEVCVSSFMVLPVIHGTLGIGCSGCLC